MTVLADGRQRFAVDGDSPGGMLTMMGAAC